MKLKSALYPIGIILPILIYLVYSYTYSYNMFYQDDFDLIYYLTLSSNSSNWQEAFSIWYKQQNDHRVLYPRLVTFLVYYFEGFINWKTVVLMGNLLWVSITYFYWKSFESLHKNLLWFIPVTLILFHPLYSENLTWSISILQQTNVIFWQALAVYLYARDKKYWAIIPAIVATFNHGSGVCAFITIITLLLVDKRFKDVGIWILALILSMSIYFYGFSFGQSSNLSSSLADLPRLFGSFFAFFGGMSLVFSSKIELTVLTGIILYVIVAIPLIPKVINAFKGNPLTFLDKMILGNLLFLTGAGILAALTRSWQGIETMIPGRYLHYTTLLAAWAFITIVQYIPDQKRALKYVVVAFFTVYNILSYNTFHPKVRNIYDITRSEENNYLNNNSLFSIDKSFSHNIRDIYKETLDKGIVKMTHSLPIISGDNYPIDSTTQYIFNKLDENQLEIDDDHTPSKIQILGQASSTNDFFLYFEAEDKSGYWLPVLFERFSYKNLLKLHLESSNFNTRLYYHNLPKGTTRIGYLTDNQFHWTTQTLQID